MKQIVIKALLLLRLLLRYVRYNIERDINVVEYILVNCEGIFLEICFRHLLSPDDSINTYYKFKDNEISMKNVRNIFLITSVF